MRGVRNGPTDRNSLRTMKQDCDPREEMLAVPRGADDHFYSEASNAEVSERIERMDCGCELVRVAGSFRPCDAGHRRVENRAQPNKAAVARREPRWVGLPAARIAPIDCRPRETFTGMARFPPGSIGLRIAKLQLSSACVRKRPRRGDEHREITPQAWMINAGFK